MAYGVAGLRIYWFIVSGIPTSMSTIAAHMRHTETAELGLRLLTESLVYWLSELIVLPMYRVTEIRCYWVTDIPFCRVTDTPMYGFTGVLMYWFAVHWFIGVLVWLARWSQTHGTPRAPVLKWACKPVSTARRNTIKPVTEYTQHFSVLKGLHRSRRRIGLLYYVRGDLRRCG